MNSEILNKLHAESEIRRVLAQYCRGLDRMDRAMAERVWHADGTANYHGMFEGSGTGFIDWVWQMHARAENHSHQIAQSLIEVDGDTARSESYVTVALWMLPADDGQRVEVIGRGRYLDCWSCREGRWAIDHREHILDQQQMRPLHSPMPGEGSFRDAQDYSCAFWK